jgi:pimeloyl-ACP methyl ester carboxylesterase
MKLNYIELGEGQPLIVLHGLFGSLDNWMTLGKEWAEDYNVFLVDQRNHGQSPHSKDFTYSLLAQDLFEFIEEHNIENPIILGHSMGGKTAMEFAVNYPKKLEKLIVVDIAPVSYEVHHYEIIDALKSVPLSEIKSRKEADGVLSKKIKEFGVRQFLLKNLYWKEKEQLAWRFNLEVLADEIIPTSEFSISAKKFSKPTLFIKGGNSNYILKEHESKIGEKFSNYKLNSISGAGHWVHAEKKDEFSKIVNDFLS